MQVLLFGGPAFGVVNDVVVVQVVNNLIRIDEGIRGQLHQYLLTFNAQIDQLVFTQVKGNRLGCCAVHYKTCKPLTLVTRGIGFSVDCLVQEVADFFHQHLGDRCVIGRGQPVRIEVDGGLSGGAGCRKRALGTLQLGLAAQFHPNVQLPLLSLQEQLVHSSLPVGCGFGSCLTAIEQRIQLFTGIGPRQQIRHQFFSPRLGTRQGFGGCSACCCLNAQVYRARRGVCCQSISHCGPIKHEPGLQGHQARGFALQCLLAHIGLVGKGAPLQGAAVGDCT